MTCCLLCLVNGIYSVNSTQVYGSSHHCRVQWHMTCCLMCLVNDIYRTNSTWVCDSTRHCPWLRHQMETIFRVTGPLCGEFTGHRWIPLTKASDAKLWCFLWSSPEKHAWVNNREAGDLRRHRAHCDVIVMRVHWTMTCCLVGPVNNISSASRTRYIHCLNWKRSWTALNPESFSGFVGTGTWAWQFLQMFYQRVFLIIFNAIPLSWRL